MTKIRMLDGKLQYCTFRDPNTLIAKWETIKEYETQRCRICALPHIVEVVKNNTLVFIDRKVVCKICKTKNEGG